MRATQYNALTDGARFRVVAYLRSGSSPYAYTYTSSSTLNAEYTYDSATEKLKKSGSAVIQLETGSYYKFVHYSLNQAGSVPAYDSATDLLTTDVNPQPSATTNDLLWGESGDVQAGTSSPVAVSLNHRFARVRLMIMARSDVNLSNVSVSFTSNYKGKMQVLNGSFPSASQTLTNPQALAGESLPAGSAPAALSTTQFVYSDYSLVHAAGNYVALKMSGKVNNTNFTDKIVLFQGTLYPGGSYTLKVTFRKAVTWAGSNIYWDGSKLTFKEAGYVGDENRYQGVYFHWGSLVGISPEGFFTSSATPLYVHSSGAWTTTTAEAAYNNGSPLYPGFIAPSLAGIPRIRNSDGTPLSGRDTHYLSTLTTYADNKGDICSFINSDYRMPMSSEFGTGATDWSDWATGSSSSTNVSFGQQIIAGYRTFKPNPAPFPASGYLREDNILEVVGVYGYYWSGSAAGMTGAYGLSFTNSKVYAESGNMRGFAFSVRCVKK
jgi:hypothetical protein